MFLNFQKVEGVKMNFDQGETVEYTGRAIVALMDGI